MVAHDEDLSVGDLIGEGDVRVAEGLLHQVGLLQKRFINIDSAVLLDVHPLAGPGDDPLHQDLVVVVKGDDIPLLQLVGLQGEDDLTVLQGGGHGTAVDLQHRKPQRGHQNGNGRHGDQGVEGAFQHRTVPGAVFDPVQLCLQLLGGGLFGDAAVFHGVPFPIGGLLPLEWFGRYALSIA